MSDSDSPASQPPPDVLAGHLNQPADQAEWTPTVEQSARLAAAEAAVAPWWPRLSITAVVHTILALTATVAVSVAASGSNAVLVSRDGLVLLTASPLVPLVCGALVVTMAALWLVVRRRGSGAVLVTLYGVALAALFGQWLVVLWSDTVLAQHGVLLLVSGVLAITGAIAAVLGAATLGRLMRVGKVLGTLGATTFSTPDSTADQAPDSTADQAPDGSASAGSVDHK